MTSITTKTFKATTLKVIELLLDMSSSFTFLIRAVSQGKASLKHVNNMCMKQLLNVQNMSSVRTYCKCVPAAN